MYEIKLKNGVNQLFSIIDDNGQSKSIILEIGKWSEPISDTEINHRRINKLIKNGYAVKRKINEPKKTPIKEEKVKK